MLTQSLVLAKHDLNESPSHDVSKKTALKNSQILSNEKIQYFYEEFQPELDKQNSKKLFERLDALTTDLKWYVNAHAMVSDKAINEFINNGLQLIYKELELQKDFDQFLQDSKSN